MLGCAHAQLFCCLFCFSLWLQHKVIECQTEGDTQFILEASTAPRINLLRFMHMNRPQTGRDVMCNDLKKDHVAEWMKAEQDS